MSLPPLINFSIIFIINNNGLVMFYKIFAVASEKLPLTPSQRVVSDFCVSETDLYNQRFYAHPNFIKENAAADPSQGAFHTPASKSKEYAYAMAKKAVAHYQQWLLQSGKSTYVIGEVGPGNGFFAEHFIRCFIQECQKLKLPMGPDVIRYVIIDRSLSEQPTLEKRFSSKDFSVFGKEIGIDFVKADVSKDMSSVVSELGGLKQPISYMIQNEILDDLPHLKIRPKGDSYQLEVPLPYLDNSALRELPKELSIKILRAQKSFEYLKDFMDQDGVPYSRGQKLLLSQSLFEELIAWELKSETIFDIHYESSVWVDLTQVPELNRSLQDSGAFSYIQNQIKQGDPGPYKVMDPSVFEQLALVMAPGSMVVFEDYFMGLRQPEKPHRIRAYPDESTTLRQYTHCVSKDHVVNAMGRKGASLYLDQGQASLFLENIPGKESAFASSGWDIVAFQFPLESGDVLMTESPYRHDVRFARDSFDQHSIFLKDLMDHLAFLARLLVRGSLGGLMTLSAWEAGKMQVLQNWNAHVADNLGDTYRDCWSQDYKSSHHPIFKSLGETFKERGFDYTEQSVGAFRIRGSIIKQCDESVVEKEINTFFQIVIMSIFQFVDQSCLETVFGDGIDYPEKADVSLMFGDLKTLIDTYQASTEKHWKALIALKELNYFHSECKDPTARLSLINFCLDYVKLVMFREMHCRWEERAASLA